MIRFPIVEDESKKIRHCIPTKFIFTDPLALDAAELIPIDLGGRLIAPTVSINELGKQLLKAAAEGDVDEIKSLLTKGAAFTADWLGTSPLHLAAQNNHLEICEILLRAGISRDARTKVDRTPLHMAAYEGHLEIVETLLRHGADLECKDLLGMTPLHWAVQNGHYEVVDILVKRGADINVGNKFELSPIDIATQISRSDIIELLSNGGTDSSIAAQNLVVQLSAEPVVDCSDIQDITCAISEDGDHTESLPLETVLLTEDSLPSESVQIEDIDESQEEELQNADHDASQTEENTFSDSIQLLQDHGITMLPNDDNNFLNLAMENGHTVVLTDVGREMLNTVDQLEEPPRKIITLSADDFIKQTDQPPKKIITISADDFIKHTDQPPKKIITLSADDFKQNDQPARKVFTLPTEDFIKQAEQPTKKIITLSAEEFLAMTNATVNNKNNFINQIRMVPRVKRIVMKKNKVIPVTNMVNISPIKALKQDSPLPAYTDMEIVMIQLIEARKTIEEYKAKLLKSEQEAERYKEQVRLLMESK